MKNAPVVKLPQSAERTKKIQRSLQEYMAVGLSTEEADYPTAEAAITRLYGRVGLKAPFFVRLDSPLGAELYIRLYESVVESPAQLMDYLWAQPRAQLGAQLDSQLVTQLRTQLRTQFKNQLGDQLGARLVTQLRTQLDNQLMAHLGVRLDNQFGAHFWDQLSTQLRAQLSTQLSTQLRAQFDNQLGDQLDTQLRDQLENQGPSYRGTIFWGSMDSATWGWADGGRRVGAVYPPEVDQALDDHIAICKSIGWWYPYKDQCIVTGRPSVISLDDVGRLHSVDGPAIRYKDGYSLYAVHGVRVPSWIVDRPQEITIEKIDAEGNAEIRRVMIERFMHSLNREPV